MDTKLPYANSTAGQAAGPRPGSQARALPLPLLRAAAAAAASGSTLLQLCVETLKSNGDLGTAHIRVHLSRAIGAPITLWSMALLLPVYALLAATVTLTVGAATGIQLEAGQRQLMIDDFLLDTSSFRSSSSVAPSSSPVAPVLRMHPARKTGEIVITPDQPWEGVIFYYDSIVQVGQGSSSEYRIY
jgi:hypothetical protein